MLTLGGKVCVNDKVYRAKLMIVKLHSCVIVLHFKQTVPF
jgi:hypothetical protein